MKSRTLKFLIVSFAAAALVVSGVILIRQRVRQKGRLQPKVQSRRYPHKHIPSSEWEAGAKLTAVSHTMRQGETLSRIADLRYGHQKYSLVIKLFNHIEDEHRIETGTVLRLPDISTILEEEGFTKVAAPEAEMILCSRAKYDKVVNQLWDMRVHADNGYAVPESVRQELLEAADDLGQATEGLKTGKAGTTAAPASMIGQLEDSMGLMTDLAGGEHADPNGYDIDMVQQRYALALTYAIIWARDGFQTGPGRS